MCMGETEMKVRMGQLWTIVLGENWETLRGDGKGIQGGRKDPFSTWRVLNKEQRRPKISVDTQRAGVSVHVAGDPD